MCKLDRILDALVVIFLESEIQIFSQKVKKIGFLRKRKRKNNHLNFFFWKIVTSIYGVNLQKKFVRTPV